MRYLFGALAGLLLGALGAFLNYRINLAALKKGNSRAFVAASIGRLGVDLAALGVIFLLRKRLPFSYEAAMLAAAVALSLGSIALAFFATRPKE